MQNVPCIRAHPGLMSVQVLTKCPMVSEFPVPLFGDDRQVLLDGLPFAKTLAYHRTLR